MTTETMDKQLQSIFEDLFGVRDSDYSDRLSIDDVDNWDSVTHVTLILCSKRPLT